MKHSYELRFRSHRAFTDASLSRVSLCGAFLVIYNAYSANLNILYPATPLFNPVTYGETY